MACIPVPGGLLGGGRGRKPAQEMGEVVVIWAEVESDVFRKVGPTKAHGARRGGQLALGILPSLPACDGVSLLSGTVTSEMRPLQPSPVSFPFSKWSGELQYLDGILSLSYALAHFIPSKSVRWVLHIRRCHIPHELKIVGKKSQKLPKSKT